MKHHHLRINYEKVAAQLSKESNISFPTAFRSMSDFRLLSCINEMLQKLNCELMNADELERELL